MWFCGPRHAVRVVIGRRLWTVSLTLSLCTEVPPSVRKNRERRRLWIADDNRVPVSPECWGLPLIGCNVNAMTEIISGVVIGEWTSRFPGEKLSLCGHSNLFTGICISALSKRHENLRPTMFAAPVAGASVCTGRYCKYNKREGIQNPTLTAKVGQAYLKKIILMNWLFD